mgnify:FL=1
MKKFFERVNERFLKVADAVSFGMGTPTNIFFWILAIVIWFVLGYWRSDLFVRGSFLPDWFTSNAWNFPLNTITTLAELYIGFLVAAATNRSERKLRKIIITIKTTLDKVETLNRQQTEMLTMLMKDQKRELAKENEMLRQVKGLTQSMETDNVGGDGNE